MIKSFALATVLAACGLAAQPMLKAPLSALDTAANAQTRDYRTSSERYQQYHTSRDRAYYSGKR